MNEIFNAMETALREYEALHEKWMNTPVWAPESRTLASEVGAKHAAYLDAMNKWQEAKKQDKRIREELEREKSKPNPISGSMVLGRRQGTIFIRLPYDLQTPIVGGCDCNYCKKARQENPDFVSKWDTLAVTQEAPKKGNDYCWTVHMPDVQACQL